MVAYCSCRDGSGGLIPGLVLGGEPRRKKSVFSQGKLVCFVPVLEVVEPGVAPPP